MVEWQKEILEGMKLIKSGCSKNSLWTNCEYCPFDTLCDALMGSMESRDKIIKPTPEEWEV